VAGLRHIQISIAILLLALLMTVLFWGPLWLGYGFIGGDLYPYFFPQKTFLADRLHAGEFPLWNNLTGFGYPVLGESQTGAAYPPYLVAYYLWPVNTAYNLQHLLHYVLCFVGTWLFARRLGLGISSAILTAIVFTYGWFPPRSCLEWAIVTGAWLPLALWCVESFIQTRWWRYAIGLSIVLGLQLLAGHFHLAFITQLLIVAYGSWRIYSSGQRPDQAASQTKAANFHRYALIVPLTLSIVAGFLIAAVQLVPAWELKTRSSRATVGRDHEPSYGHLPPLYASQMIAPWMWYSPLEIDGDDTIRNIAELAAPWHWFGPHRALDESLMQSRAGGLTDVATNKVEAHLYCGLIPLALAVWWCCWGRRRGFVKQSVGHATGKKQSTAIVSSEASSTIPFGGEAGFWLVAGALALIYATGWLLPIGRYIPGFNFFRGPGRYGIVTTLAVAILAGRGLQCRVQRRSLAARVAILCFVFWSTVGDLWLVSRMVTYAVMVSRPPIALREQSPVRKLLLDEVTLPRLYAPGQNLGNLLGVSCLPVYLGIAPAEYSDRLFAGDGMPKSDDSQGPVKADPGFSTWLRDSGVTHILSFSPLDEASWKATPLWQGVDPLLNSAWGRGPEPIFLYKLNDSLGRASLLADAANSRAEAPAQREANRFVVKVDAAENSTLLARELEYPGWTVAVDGNAAVDSSRGMFREVQVPVGSHEAVWRYRPWSVRLGLIITLSMLFILAAMGHLRFWHRTWLDRVLGRSAS
jgi:hypothetical protein